MAAMEINYKYILGLSLFIFTGCISKNSSNDISNLEKKLILESKITNTQNNINSKWIQASNKNEECKVYVQIENKNDRTLDENFKIFWDGDCKNGYAIGLGREFEKNSQPISESIAIYKNPPFEKPNYYYTKSNLNSLEIKGDSSLGYKVITSEKDKYLIKRYVHFNDDKSFSLINYEDQSTEVFKKIYPNFNYEIIYNKSNNNYSFYLNDGFKKSIIKDIDKRKNIINEVLNAKEKAIEASKKSDLTISQYKNKICKDYISVNFMDDYEYKSICPNTINKIDTYISKENTKDELDFLLQNSQDMRLNKNSYAIILGIEDYLLESNVNYSKNSANMFSKYANKILGVPSENIWSFIKDRETSSGFIKAQWIDFLSMIPKDSTIYFYYSGHGVPGNDGNAYILPSDTNAETIVLDKQFMLSNIYKNLNKSNAKKIVAFIDSCFSGKDDNGNLLFGGVAPVLKYNPTEIDKSKITLLTAGGANEFSNQYKEKQHRLFSFYLMKGLAKGYTNSEDLFNYVKKNVLDKSRKIGYAYKQIPEISGVRNINLR